MKDITNLETFDLSALSVSLDRANAPRRIGFIGAGLFGALLLLLLMLSGSVGRLGFPDDAAAICAFALFVGSALLKGLVSTAKSADRLDITSEGFELSRSGRRTKVYLLRAPVRSFRLTDSRGYRGTIPVSEGERLTLTDRWGWTTALTPEAFEALKRKFSAARWVVKETNTAGNRAGVITYAAKGPI
ncbi:MAG TPA: hypothetical protein VMH38_07970 [Thermoplasmata archaeon]|nr:hypothetical protein [Thermoplasmata archaeon]